MKGKEQREIEITDMTDERLYPSLVEDRQLPYAIQNVRPSSPMNVPPVYSTNVCPKSVRAIRVPCDDQQAEANSMMPLWAEAQMQKDQIRHVKLTKGIHSLDTLGKWPPPIITLTQQKTQKPDRTGSEGPGSRGAEYAALTTGSEP